MHLSIHSVAINASEGRDTTFNNQIDTLRINGNIKPTGYQPKITSATLIILCTTGIIRSKNITLTLYTTWGTIKLYGFDKFIIVRSFADLLQCGRNSQFFMNHDILWFFVKVLYLCLLIYHAFAHTISACFVMFCKQTTQLLFLWTY